MLKQETITRIENEAKEFLLSEHFKPQYIWTNDIRNTYIACAKKYEEKQQVLVEALEKIAYSIKYFKAEADKEGNRLDGLGALALSNNSEWLKSIAKQALEQFKTTL